MIFLDLPFEILLEISQHVTIGDSCSLLRVNKFMHTLLVGDWFRNLVRHHQDFALGLAVLHHKMDVVRKLVALGADVNHPIKLDTGESGLGFEMPLHIAAEHSNTKMVRLLLDLGAHVEIQNSDGHTPLFEAILWRRDLCIVKEIMCRTPHSSRFIVDHVRHETALHIAAKLGFAELISIFLERGLDVHARNSSGVTALRYAKVAMKKRLWVFGLDTDMDMDLVAETTRILTALGEHPLSAMRLAHAWADQGSKLFWKLLESAAGQPRPES